MKIKFQEEFLFKLNKKVDYISKDKPSAARKFKIELLKNLKKDLKEPFHFKKSKHYNDNYIRDYVFKGYSIVYYIDIDEDSISIFGFIKHKKSL